MSEILKLQNLSVTDTDEGATNDQTPQRSSPCPRS